MPEPTSEASFSRSERAACGIGAALIVAATAVAYWPSLSGGFLIDDDVLLTGSRLIRAANGVYKFWLSREPIDYWPVSNTSLWLEWRLWGAAPLGYRVVNLTLHITESLLIWRLLRNLAIPGAFLAALMFAVHPVNVESVAWIAQRKTLLAMLFALLTALSYLRSEATACGDDPRSARRDTYYWLALSAFGLAMLSKISAAILPPLLLGMIGWSRPLGRRDVARAVPFFLLALALVGINIWFRANDPGIAGQTELLQRPLDAASALWLYLSKALLPFDLVFMYPTPALRPDRLQSWLPLLAAGALTWLLARYRHGWSRPLLFAWGYYCIAMLPAMGFTERMQIEDHYQHLALIGVVALVAAGWATWNNAGGTRLRPLSIAVAVAAVAGLTISTWRHAATFIDDVALMQAAARRYPESAVAHHNAGFALLRAGRLAAAIDSLEHALRLDPDSVTAQRTLGAALAESGETAAAIEHFRSALRLAPDDPETNNNFGALLRESGHPQEAIHHLRLALRSAPNSVPIHCNLGKALLQTGRGDEAIHHFERALSLDPEFAEARRLLAVARRPGDG